MSTPRRLTQRQLEADVNREVARVQEEHPRQAIERMRNPRRRCRVCHDQDALRRVNRMLTLGMRPPDIVENLADINARKRKGETIGYWSVYDHRKNHFNVQETVNAGWLRTLERRAEEEGISLADGTGSLLTLRGYLEIIAQKGLQDLIDRDQVGYTVGLDAQRELENLMKADAEHAERAALRRDVALIQQAIMEEFTEEEMSRLSRRLDVLRGVVSEDDEDTIEGEIVDEDEEGYDDSEEVADFVMDVDEDDELDT